MKNRRLWRYFLDKKEVTKEIIEAHEAYGRVDIVNGEVFINKNPAMDKIYLAYSVEYPDHFEYHGSTAAYLVAQGKCL